MYKWISRKLFGSDNERTLKRIQPLVSVLNHLRVGGVAPHRGKIAEMKTGEGKTLVATLPAYLNALDGKGVHIVTVNDYLAKRGTEWRGPVYNFLRLSVGTLQ